MARAEEATLPLFGSAILLAGGQGRRLGFDKQTIRFAGEPLVNHILKQLKPMFNDILVVTGRPGLYRQIQKELAGIRITSDLYPGQGPMAGIQAGLKLAASSYVYVTGCDMPYLSPPFIQLMMDRIRESGSLPAGAMLELEKGHLEPLNAFYAKELEGPLTASLEKGERGLQAFVRRHPFVWLTGEEARRQDPELIMCHNINKPSDLEGGPFSASPVPEMDSPLERVRVERVTEEGSRPFEDRLIREIPCWVQLGDQVSAPLYTVPDRLEDLALGWLKAKGLIGQASAVLSVEQVVQEDPEGIRIRVGQGEAGPGPEAGPLEGDLPPPSFQEVTGLMDQLESRATLFKETGGTHNMLLAASGSLEVRDHCEDISRHNCLYKLLGRAHREGRDLGGEILITSCRLTSTLISLLVGSGIRQVISQAALTEGALKLARAHGIRLIAFARDGRFNRYD